MLASSTGSRTKAVASDTANTLEMVTLIKLSNAFEKGDKFFKKFSRRPGFCVVVYCIQF